jgi:hypothetical protein
MEEAMKFRKKPVVIEAIQWPGTKFETSPPEWFTKAMYIEPGAPGFIMRWGDEIFIETMEGQMRAQPGDWIIRGIKGEIYPCKPDIFAATYEDATPSPASTAGGGRQSIGDDEKFIALARYWAPRWQLYEDHENASVKSAWAALIAHIDTFSARSADKRERELCAKMGAMQAQIDQLNADLAARSAGDAVKLLREVDAALAAAWDARELPASVISGDLVRRYRLVLGAAPAPGNTGKPSGKEELKEE